MQFRFLIIAVFLLLVIPAASPAAKEEDLDKLMKLWDIQGLLNKSARFSLSQLGTVFPECQLDQKPDVKAFIDSNIGGTENYKFIRDFYAQKFDEGELKTSVEFYRTPAGAKMIRNAHRIIGSAPTLKTQADIDRLKGDIEKESDDEAKVRTAYLATPAGKKSDVFGAAFQELAKQKNQQQYQQKMAEVLTKHVDPDGKCKAGQ